MIDITVITSVAIGILIADIIKEAIKLLLNYRIFKRQ